MLEARTAAVSARSLSSRLSETVSILLRRAGSGRTANISARWQIASGASLLSPPLPVCASGTVKERQPPLALRTVDSVVLSSPFIAHNFACEASPRACGSPRASGRSTGEAILFGKKNREMAAWPLLSSSQAPALLGRSGNSNAVSYRLVRSE